MPRPNPLTGVYVGLNQFKLACSKDVSDRDSVILRHLDAASRAIEQETRRYFIPYQTTNLFRWPQYAPQATWTLWTDEDLLSVTAVVAAASGIGAIPIPLLHYFLEPQWAGPPYSRIEIDLSSGDALQSGPTPQRSISVSGLWGYCAATVAAGTVVSGLASDATATSFVTDRPRFIDTGEVLLVDSEQLYVSDGGAGATLTVQRGVNGTTPATHANGAVVLKYQAPGDVRNAVMADAAGSYEQEKAMWGRSIGSMDMSAEMTGRAVSNYRQRVIQTYARPRSAAI